MIKLNAKLGVAAIVAALFVAFGAFGLTNPTTTSASPTNPLTVTVASGPNVAGAVAGATSGPSGTTVAIHGVFSNNNADLTISCTSAAVVAPVSPIAAANKSCGTFTLVKAQEFTSVTPAVLDITALAGNQDPAGVTYKQTCGALSVPLNPACPLGVTGNMAQYPVQPPTLQSLAYDLTMVVTCTSDIDVVFTAVQLSLPGPNNVLAGLSVPFHCQVATSGVLTIKKVDQLGVIRGASFAVQQQVPVGSGNWITIATMVTSGTLTSQNPCSSNTSCATNGTQYCTNGFNTNCAQTPGSLPPTVAGGVDLSTINTPIRVIEISQPTSCTLVSITDGTGLNIIQPVTINNISTATSSSRSLTFINSCQTPLAPVVANSAIAVVIGGATQGLSDSTHLEIVPAPGSDDDARVDIRVRDTNSTNVVGAHVTMSIDKGAMSMRTDTTGPGTNCATLGTAGFIGATNNLQTVTGVDSFGNPIYGNINPFGGTVLPNNCYTGNGYEVIEPTPGATYFGSSYAGDTCDQDLVQQYNQATYTYNPTTGTYAPVSGYNGGITAPFLLSGSGQLRQIQDGYTNTDGIISACVYVNSDLAPGVTPGKMNITVIVEAPQAAYYPYGSANIILTASIPVVGPPASIKVAASPTSVQCGEKSTITATITDSVGQNVSDHTRVELVSNAGATIGGTGSTLGFPGFGTSNPASSSAAETFSGVATAFLLTSTEHVGPYEVVVASGGSVGGVVTTAQPGVVNQTGAFSTAPVSAQVTVTCALPVTAAPAAPIAAAPIAAPRTGEGIRPPNTGDAGLADASGSSWAFVLAGAVAFGLAGVASVKFARR